MKLLSFLLPALLLAGCATVPVPGTVTSHASFPLPSALPASWQLHGRISLTQGETGWHAGVDWNEHIDDFQMRVSGPLGQGGFLLTGNGGGVLLRDSRDQTYFAPDAETLLHDVTGWVLPVSGMRYWVRGIPDPGVTFVATTDTDGRLLELSQAGWVIHYTRYHEDPDGRWPARLSLLRDDVSVRLVIDRWNFGQSSAAVP